MPKFQIWIQLEEDWSEEKKVPAYVTEEGDGEYFKHSEIGFVLKGDMTLKGAEKLISELQDFLASATESVI